jgi:hypothetical protein
MIYFYEVDRGRNKFLIVVETYMRIFVRQFWFGNEIFNRRGGSVVFDKFFRGVAGFVVFLLLRMNLNKNLFVFEWEDG